MTSEPTLGEIMRRLDDVTLDLTNAVGQIVKVAEESARTYVRQDVYAEARKHDQARIQTLEADNEMREAQARDFRKQLLFMVLGFSIPALGGLILSLNTVLSTQGK